MQHLPALGLQGVSDTVLQADSPSLWLTPAKGHCGQKVNLFQLGLLRLQTDKGSLVRCSPSKSRVRDCEQGHRPNSAEENVGHLDA